MALTEDTTIDDLLREHPFLEEYLVAKSPRYRSLKNPAMRAVMGKVATLHRVARVGGFEPAAFLADLEAAIQAGPKEGVDRLERLKALLLDLHRGADAEETREKVRPLIAGLEPSQIVQIGQSLVDAGVPETEVKALSELHSELFRKALEGVAPPEVPPGHPLHTHLAENRAAEGILAEAEALTQELGDPPDGDRFEALRRSLSTLVARLSEINTHYRRKEHQLFPILEAKGLSGPPQVMWAVHDEIRTALRHAAEALASAPPDAGVAALQGLAHSVREMIYKEERILFPMCLDSFTEEDWGRVKAGEDEIGFAWVQPTPGGPAPTQPARGSDPGQIPFATGTLTGEQLELIFARLPVELTFVDENDRVAYYSNAPERIFPRSPGIIGRRVQNCHPPQSVGRVLAILEEFKTGRRDSAEFWIRLQERLIHIRYFALRSGDAYVGTLEVAQDVTPLQELRGEKRLLDEPA